LLDEVSEGTLNMSGDDHTPALHVHNGNFGSPHTANIQNVRSGETGQHLLDEVYNDSNKIGLVDTLRLRSS